MCLFVFPKRRRHQISYLCLLTFFIKRIKTNIITINKTGHIPVLGVLQLEPGLSRVPTLAVNHKLFLLWCFGIGFRLPHVLPGEILPNARGRDVSREIGGFLLDARVRCEFVNDDRTVRERAVFREQFDVYDGVRVGEEERKREHVLSRVVFVHGAVFAVGIVGV